jgi:hypothetical protein
MEKNLLDYVNEAAAEWFKDHPEAVVQADKKNHPNDFGYRLSAVSFWEATKAMARIVDRLLERTT